MKSGKYLTLLPGSPRWWSRAPWVHLPPVVLLLEGLWERLGRPSTQTPSFSAVTNSNTIKDGEIRNAKDCEPPGKVWVEGATSHSSRYYQYRDNENTQIQTSHIQRLMYRKRNRLREGLRLEYRGSTYTNIIAFSTCTHLDMKTTQLL